MKIKETDYEEAENKDLDFHSLMIGVGVGSLVTLTLIFFTYLVATGAL